MLRWLLPLGAVFALAACAAVPGSHSLAQTPKPALTIAQAQAIVGAASGQNAKVIAVFAGPPPLTGVILDGALPSEHQVVAWVMPGPHPLMIVGAVLAANGRDLTTVATTAYQQARRQSVSPSTLTRDALFAALKKAPGVIQYRGTKTLYVFFDANCVYCNELWHNVADMKADFAAHGVRVKWIPVVVLGPTSGPRGAAILRAGLPALEQNEAHFDFVNEQGAVAPLNDHALLAQVAHNTRLFLADGAQQLATPTLVWRDGRGTQISVGSPPRNQLRALLRAIRR